MTKYLHVGLRPVAQDVVDVTNIIDGHIQTPIHTDTLTLSQLSNGLFDDTVWINTWNNGIMLKKSEN